MYVWAVGMSGHAGLIPNKSAAAPPAQALRLLLLQDCPFHGELVSGIALPGPSMYAWALTPKSGNDHLPLY